MRDDKRLLPFRRDEILKRCGTCGQMKPRSNFYPRKDGKDGFTTRCRLCHNSIAGPKSKEWARLNPGRVKLAQRTRYMRCRDLAYRRYGGCCACCGECRPSMLELDHVNNDGHIDRRRPTNRIALYRKLGATPNPSYQLLCSNCNHSKSRNGGICEHMTEGQAVPMAEAP